MLVTFLGTSGSIPTANRNLPSMAILRQSELFLFDCGEGTQRQMFIARVGFGRKTKIFITHMHGDHVLGLPGLFQTMSLLGREEPLEVFGPPGLQKFIEAFKKTVQFGLTFPVIVEEIRDGRSLYETRDYSIRCAQAEHSIPALAYGLFEKERPGRFHPEKAMALGIPKGPKWSQLQYNEPIALEGGRIVTPKEVTDPRRPGRKIVYSGDTKPSARLAKFAQGADLLVHDSTFGDDLQEKASEEGHSTASQAAQIAEQSKVSFLALFHLSARYVNPKILLEEAKQFFTNVFVAEDFMTLNISYKKT
ncbi:MAG TPA: ribonuclease Z [Candidatus Bathyarchaeia archaeon]|nr:MAG: ribonuclease Z [Candidatus Bathyarchaeota archaeon RBG_16_48_13]HJX24315.1 ribonuclease Z [Candidatus Bathyarchaeia archaeon]